ncbi:putative secreted protein (Por secretion system target) [Mariniflexile fucanivorans]|uniref:Putative secreted protein (Por secretion system target) n=1 Tax=Mariniflexile fucanivorans TaxID=264023 RepID=A0A4R1RL81_9FLAO|nr:sulfatase-like hydrolase/transferase [Mariniflexile fucanivorans]TCL66846.1 putative secreted protein (Por secretion system target) [Mariniflexile fucanivorans]
MKYMISKKLQAYLLVALCMVPVTQVIGQTQGTRPNIIVILADDLGYGDVGFNRSASFPTDLGVIPTPNIDQLANNSIILGNAHVAHPFCGPSRAALLTGMYPHRIGAQYNLPNDITSTLGIPTNETFFSNLLQDSGYNTAAFGKWHLGFAEGSYQPLDRGFDYFFGFLGGGKGYFENGYEDAFYRRLGSANPVTNEYQDPLQRNRNYVAESEFSDAENEDYLTDILTDDAINYFNNNKNQTDPFFMYLAYNAPHTPLEAIASEIAQFKIDNPNFEDLVRNSTYITESNQVTKWPLEEQPQKIEEFVQDRITYATMVSNLDKNIGRLVTEMKKDINVYNNTVIIFLSDNGGYTYSKGAVNYPLDALKGSVLEGGHKVPMFVHWPDKISTKTNYDYQISALDLYPTLVNLAGATVPPNKIIDGKDFMDKLIAGEELRPNGEPIYIVRPQNGFQNGAIMSYPWKIVKTGGSGNWKLYNIINDPGETSDVRASEPNAETIIQNLLDYAVAWAKDFKDVKPAWYDNDDGGNGHPHSALWDDGTLPAYDLLFESSELLLESELNKISITGITDAVEGITDGKFKVSLPDGVLASQDITINYSVSGDATNGTDYTALSGSITILNGTNYSEINIQATTDGINEISEAVTITLQSTNFGSVNVTPANINVFDVIVPTPLTAGDIAIVGFKAESGNKGAVAFMLLKDISATTKMSFSNRSWKGSQDGWTGSYSIDDVWTWTAGEPFLSGTILKLDSDGLVKQIKNDVEITVGSTVHNILGKDDGGTDDDSDFDLSPAGDTVLIYQTPEPFAELTSGTDLGWITGLNTNSTLWGDGGGNSFSAIPTALIGFTIDATNGVNADMDNGIYNAALSGSPSQLRGSINNGANWTTSEDDNYNLWSFNETSSGISGDIGSVGTLAIADILKAELSIFPNPTSDYFNINFDKPVNKLEIEILSMSGKTIKKVKGTNTEKPRIQVSDLAQGMYLIKVKADNHVCIEKVLKI